MLEFSRVPYSDPKQKRASARSGGGGGGGGGGGNLPVLIKSIKMIINIKDRGNK